jgi:hypothetical protein|eukprot:COSAG01_NODE_7679_length_3101_cov_2.571286_2_plen_382_part_00
MDPLIQNAVHIVLHRSKNPLPKRHLDAVTPAYGDREMVKLTRLLGHADTVTRDNALVALHSTLQKPQLRSAGVSAGVVPALRANLADPSLAVRAHTATAFNMLAGHPLGVAAMVEEEGTIVDLTKLLEDSEDTVRVAAYQALITVAKSVAGSQQGVGWSGNTDEEGGGGGAGALANTPGFVASIVDKSKDEPEHLRPFALDLLGALLRLTRAVDQALLSSPAIETMTALLDSYSPSVRQKAAENLALLTFPIEAKPMAIAAGSIEKLVGLLSDDDFKIRSGAASALCAICAAEQARDYAAQKAGMLDVLPALVADTYEGVSRPSPLSSGTTVCAVSRQFAGATADNPRPLWPCVRRRCSSSPSSCSRFSWRNPPGGRPCVR